MWMNVSEGFLKHMKSVFPKYFTSSREGVPYNKRIGSLISAFSKTKQKTDATIKYWTTEFESSVKMNLCLTAKEIYFAFTFLKSTRYKPQRPHKDFTNKEIRSGYGN